MGAPIHVLIVEDSEDDALLIAREIHRGGFEPVSLRVDSPEGMAAALRERKWDVVVSDYLMPRFSGLDAFRTLRESGLDIPFIMVSGKIGEETAVEAMRTGVHDYIMKNNLHRLVPAIERELQEAERRLELRRARVELRKYRERLEELVRERTTELTREIERLHLEATERERVEGTLRELIREYQELEENVRSSYTL